MKQTNERPVPNIQRCNANPLLTPTDVTPSDPRLHVDGIFNCGATVYQDEIILLCRVAESVLCDRTHVVSFPVTARQGNKTVLKVVEIQKAEHPELDFSDSRTIHRKAPGRPVVHLTSLSHLRLARSKDGVHFRLDTHPFVMPDPDTECWGMEDPRITRIGDTYYINYTAVSPNGAQTSLISTKDFTTFKRLGCIFLPENKDVTLFPQRINGKYLAFSRPVPHAIGSPDIWLSDSDDLLHWGAHRHFCGTAVGGWEGRRIGGGAPPFLTPAGWVKIYHAADQNQRYCLGAFLLDRDDPSRILAKSQEPLLQPETDYELNGFFGNVVFTCGCVLRQNILQIYYGAADDKICRADISLEDLYHHLGR